MNRPAVRKIVTAIYKIFRENENLSIFRDNISVGKVTTNGRFVEIAKILFYKRAPNETPDSFDNSIVEYSAYDEGSFPLIRIGDFSLRDLPEYCKNFDYDENGGRRQSKSVSFQKLFNTRHYCELPMKKLGVNVFRSKDLKGYLLNFNDVRKILEKDTDLVMNVVNFCFVSKKNILLAIIFSDGSMIIREQAIQKMAELWSEEDIKLALKNLLIIFKSYHDKFVSVNMEQIEEDITDEANQYILNSMSRISKLYLPEFANLTEGQKIDEFLKVIKDQVKSKVKEILSEGAFGCTSYYSYANLVLKIMKAQKDGLKDHIVRAFRSGVELGVKLEILGWTPMSNINFPEENRPMVWWEKEVNIVPDTFIWKGERYKIPENERKFKVSKVYVNHVGKMRCNGNHPNVSGTTVCMGDLVIDWTASVDDIKDALERAATLLDIINYDSAYNSAQLDPLLKVSTKIDVLAIAGLRSDDKKLRTTVRELSDDTDDDVSGEIAPEAQPKKSKDYEVKDIAKVVATQSRPADRPNRSDRYATDNNHEHLIEHDTSMDVAASTTTTTSTYYVDPQNFVAQLSSVNVLGATEPLIRITPSPTVSDQIALQDPLIENQRNRNELSLGDSNLIR